MSKKSAGRPEMSKSEFDRKCEQAIALSREGKTATQIAQAMGYKSRQAIHKYLYHDTTKCRCCHQPLKTKKKQNGKGT